MNLEIRSDDTLQSCLNRILNSGDFNEPIAKYLATIIQVFGVSGAGGGDMRASDYAAGTGAANTHTVDHAAVADQATNTVPLSGIAQLGQLELQAALDDPSVPGMQGGAIVLVDPAGSKASLGLADLYIIWTNKGDTARTGLYVDASGDLYAYQLTGLNAGKRVDITKGHWA